MESLIDLACQLDLTMQDAGSLYAIATWPETFSADAARLDEFLAGLSDEARHVAWGILNYPLFQCRNDAVSKMVDCLMKMARKARSPKQ